MLFMLKGMCVTNAITVQSDKKDYSGPSFCDSIANCVPIYPVTNCSDIYGEKLEQQ